MPWIPGPPVTDPVLLSVADLGISFLTREGRLRAVDGISFDLKRGQTLGIVGESGSGKSVLCYSLLRLLPSPPAHIDRGTARFQGRDLLRLSHNALRSIRGNRICMVFQDPMTSLNPYVTIGKQVVAPLRIHAALSPGKAIGRAIEALEQVGIDQAHRRINHYPHQLSGGMRQRVIIAMALVNNPDILIADEPTTALDVTVQARILDLIGMIRKQNNLATIFVSHDLSVIAGIADEILVMQKGKAVEQGPTDKIFYHPGHPYTRKLLASIPSGSKPDRFDPAARVPENRVLSVEHLQTVYPDNSFFRFSGTPAATTAVDDVSFELYQGETLGVVGESGSGKSTLARSIIRLIHISGGRIILNGKDLARLSAGELRRERRKIQMIFQDPFASLNPRMTVYDTLSEAVRTGKKQTDTAILGEVRQLMRDVGLDPGHIRKYPHEFSGGQRQRIAIARALALKPGVIIADEPVSALDVTVQAKILELLRTIVQEYCLTMIFISHDLSVVRYVADRTAVMLRGKIVELGETETVFKFPGHPYTRTLLSAIPVPDPARERRRRRHQLFNRT